MNTDCVNPGDAGGVVNFTQFNCQIWRDDLEGNPIGSLIRRIQQGNVVEGFETPGGVISAAWPYLFGIAGLILFAMLIWGAMEIMFGAATPKSADSGKKRITNAVIGFVILFMVFWIGQLVQQIFGLNIGLAAPQP